MHSALILHDYRLDIACIVFFGGILALQVPLPRLIVWQQRLWE